MASPRTSRARTRTGSSRPTSRRAPSSNNAALIGGLAAVVVVVALVFVLSRGGSTPAAAGDGGSTTKSSSEPPSPSPSPSAAAPDLSSGTARAGKTPDRPAPSIAPADLQRAEEHYQAAKEHWNEGQRARSAGDQTRYAQALQAAFDELEEQREALRTYTDWFEEADFGDWAMPAEYDALQRKLGEYDRLFQRVKKLKQVR